jgi:hypothetical protein
VADDDYEDSDDAYEWNGKEIKDAFLLMNNIQKQDKKIRHENREEMESSNKNGQIFSDIVGLSGFGSKAAVLTQDVSLGNELKEVKEKLADTEKKNSELKEDKFNANLKI